MRKLKSEIDLEVEGDNGQKKTYTLRYDLNALDMFEEIYDKSILEVFSPSIDENGTMLTTADGRPVNTSFRIGMVRNLIWVGLQAYHPEITQKEVGAMFDLQEANTSVMPRIAEAIAASNKQQFPQEEPDKVRRAPKK